MGTHAEQLHITTSMDRAWPGDGRPVVTLSGSITGFLKGNLSIQCLLGSLEEHYRNIVKQAPESGREGQQGAEHCQEQALHSGRSLAPTHEDGDWELERLVARQEDLD